MKHPILWQPHGVISYNICCTCILTIMMLWEFKIFIKSFAKRSLFTSCNDQNPTPPSAFGYHNSSNATQCFPSIPPKFPQKHLAKIWCIWSKNFMGRFKAGNIDTSIDWSILLISIHFPPNVKSLLCHMNILLTIFWIISTPSLEHCTTQIIIKKITLLYPNQPSHSNSYY